eukprot:695502-Prorocentrum_minimum.AAC.2
MWGKLKPSPSRNPSVLGFPRFYRSSCAGNGKDARTTPESKLQFGIQSLSCLRHEHIPSPLVRLVPTTGGIFPLPLCDWCPIRAPRRRERAA